MKGSSSMNDLKYEPKTLTRITRVHIQMFLQYHGNYVKNN